MTCSINNVVDFSLSKLLLRTFKYEKSTMADQRGLIQTLLEEKIANDAKYDTLSKSIQGSKLRMRAERHYHLWI
jgi:hypothetical protein